ncbi:MAG: hypothetical protein J0H41_08045 [Rhizobiales bacterium]|nr:hypothetical protein [Hyphomicrobiales bacterium]
MNRPIEAIILAVACAILSAAIASAYIRRKGRARLTLAQLDLVSYALGVCAVISLTPEVLQAFAPELVEPGTLVSLGVNKLDYAAYVLAPIGAGVGLARRWQTMQLERAAPSAQSLVTTP